MSYENRELKKTPLKDTREKLSARFENVQAKTNASAMPSNIDTLYQKYLGSPRNQQAKPKPSKL